MSDKILQRNEAAIQSERNETRQGYRGLFPY